MVWVAGFFAHLPGAALPWPGGLTGALALGACEIGVLLAAAPRARRALRIQKVCYGISSLGC